MSPPTIITSTITNTAITLTWTTPTGVAAGGSSVVIDYYDLEWSNNASTWTSLAVAYSGNSFTHTGLTGGTTYYYRIRDHNIYGYAASFSAASAGALTCQAPS